MNKNSLAVNSVFNVIYRFLNLVFPLVTSAYIARIISSRLIGEVGYAQNITQYFVLLSALGLPNYGTREIAKTRDEYGLTNKVFSELFILNAISTSICLVAYLILVSSISVLQAHMELYLITGISIFLNYINVDWFYQGCEQYVYIALRSFVVKLFSLVAIFLCVKNSNDYLIYALISALAIAGNNMYNVLHLRTFGIKISFKNIHIIKHLKPVLNLLCTTIAIEFYTLLDTTMIGMKCSKENVAYYNYAMKISKALIAVIAAIGGVLLPRLSYYKKQGNAEGCITVVEKTLNIMIYLLLPCAIGVFICANEIISFLYGKGFSESIPILKIASMLIMTLGFSNLFGTQILITYGRESKLLLATIIGASTNVLLNWFLIEKLQGVGAAIASVISESLVTLITLYYAKKSMIVRTSKRNLIVSVASCGFMTCALLAVKRYYYIGNTLLLILEIIIGGATYILFTILLGSPVTDEIKKRLILHE